MRALLPRVVAEDAGDGELVRLAAERDRDARAGPPSGGVGDRFARPQRGRLVGARRMRVAHQHEHARRIRGGQVAREERGARRAGGQRHALRARERHARNARHARDALLCVGGEVAAVACGARAHVDVRRQHLHEPRRERVAERRHHDRHRHHERHARHDGGEAHACFAGRRTQARDGQRRGHGARRGQGRRGARVGACACRRATQPASNTVAIHGSARSVPTRSNAIARYPNSGKPSTGGNHVHAVPARRSASARQRGARRAMTCRRRRRLSTPTRAPRVRSRAQAGSCRAPPRPHPAPRMRTRQARSPRGSAPRRGSSRRRGRRRRRTAPPRRARNRPASPSTPPASPTIAPSLTRRRVSSRCVTPSARSSASCARRRTIDSVCVANTRRPPVKSATSASTSRFTRYARDMRSALSALASGVATVTPAGSIAASRALTCAIEAPGRTRTSMREMRPPRPNASCAAAMSITPKRCALAAGQEPADHERDCREAALHFDRGARRKVERRAPPEARRRCVPAAGGRADRRLRR